MLTENLFFVRLLFICLLILNELISAKEFFVVNEILALRGYFLGHFRYTLRNETSRHYLYFRTPRTQFL